MIARQRFSLNRTKRLIRQHATAAIDSSDVQDLIEQEDELAEMTGLLAEFLEQKGSFRCEFLYDAQESMLSARQSLSESELSSAGQEEQDALALLIKARNKLKELLPKCDPNALAAIRNFDRRQSQKLRRPKDQQEEVEQLVGRLRQLSKQEEEVCKMVDVAVPSGSAPGKQAPAASDYRRIQQLQRDIALDAYDVQRVMQGIDRLTELARARMNEAAERAEQASSALDRGASEEASETAGQAQQMFEDLAKHVEGLLGPETAQRISSARDLASQMARQQRELGNAMSNNPSPSAQGQASGSKGRVDEWAGRAAQLGESGHTLEDLLRALAKADGQANANVRRDVQEIFDEGRVPQMVKQMQAVEENLRHDQLKDARAQAVDIAERLDVVANRLDALHRAVIAPRLEALIAMEKRAVALQEKLQKLDSEEAITRWHHEAEALVGRLTEQSAAAANAAELLDAMHGEGWADGYQAWGWARGPNSPYRIAPETYRQSVAEIVRQLRNQARELLLADLIAAREEAVPMEYEQLVQQYFQTLSRTTTKIAPGAHEEGGTGDD